MEIREPPAFPAQLIQMRGFEHRITVGRDIAIPLVVGEQEHDVGPFARERRSVGDRCGKQHENKNGEGPFHEI